jgi:hypothetical protein
MDSGQLEDRRKKWKGDGQMENEGQELPQDGRKYYTYVYRRRNEGGVGLGNPEVEVAKKQNHISIDFP